MNLDQQKKRARELLNAVRAGDADALARVRRHHPRFGAGANVSPVANASPVASTPNTTTTPPTETALPELPGAGGGAETRRSAPSEAMLRQTMALHDAQLVIAREEGFASWPKLKAHAAPASDGQHTRLFMTTRSWYDERVQGLLEARASGVPAALDQIRAWHPRFADASDDAIQVAAFEADDARLVYAREHGFDSWDELGARVDALAQRQADTPASPSALPIAGGGAGADSGGGGRGRSNSQLAEPFMEAFEALRDKRPERLRALLRAHPDLARARGTNGNSLLNLGGSLAKGAFRADAPADARDAALAMLDALLDAGADVNQSNDRGWTPLHQAGYSNQPLLAARLIAAGAALDVEAHGAGGTPLAAALFWGHLEVTDVLAAHTIAPRNLRIAAGLGNVALIDTFFTPDGALTSDAGVARGFYRPHSGFPLWLPSPDPQEVLDEALVWACKSDRVEVLGRLIERGARMDADPYRGTPLLWAASRSRLRAVTWLLDHGADINQRATFGGPGHGQGVTALHLAAQGADLPTVQLLIARGADPTLQDDLYHGTPLGWAQHGGTAAVVEYLKSLA